MATRTRKKAAKRRSKGTAAVAQEKLLDIVHQVWLAGLGAVAKAQSGTPKLLQELVEEGARVHADTVKAAEGAARSVMTQATSVIRGRVGDMREKASDTFENLEKIFQTRVQRALQQMGVPSSKEMERLSDRVDTLNANIEKLAGGRRTAARGRAAGRKRPSNGRRRGASSAAAAH